MRLKDYSERDGKRVWLGADELQALIDEAQSPQQRVAFLLAGRCGLRRSELIQVRPADLVSGPTGHHVRVWEDYAKGEKYRQPPIPDELKTTVDTLAFGMEADESIVGVTGTSVYRWVRRAAERRQADTRDEGWSFVDVHDLRRSWGTNLLEQGVLPSVVMDWGGWEDWDTFREHYLGEFSPEAMKRERQKVDFLDGNGNSESTDASSGIQSRRSYAENRSM